VAAGPVAGGAAGAAVVRVMSCCVPLNVYCAPPLPCDRLYT